MKEVPFNIFMKSFYDTDFSDLKFPMITIYNKPLDFPDKYVGRVFDALAQIPCGVDITNIAKVNPEWALKAKVCEKCNIKHVGSIEARTNHVVLKDTLEELREAIPPRFVRLSRKETDQPNIVEVWV